MSDVIIEVEFVQKNVFVSRFRHMLIPFHLKIVVKIIALTVLIAIIFACNTETTQQSSINTKNDDVIGQVLLFGKGYNLKEGVSSIIEKSGIKKGGYVVIIPTSGSANIAITNSIKKQFNDQNIMAVHVLKFDPNSVVKNTDITAIENARILCFLGERPNKFMKLANSTRLKKSLLAAKEKVILIAGFGKGASVLGDYFYIHGRKDTLTNKKKIWLMPGLGILKNTAVNDISLLKNHKENIQKKSNKKNFIFIGLRNKTSVMIEDSIGIVLNEPGIKLISPDKEPKKLGIGDSFNLLPQ